MGFGFGLDCFVVCWLSVLGRFSDRIRVYWLSVYLGLGDFFCLL